MKNLDDFLRSIWLECCGHMSSFTNPTIKKAERYMTIFDLDDDFEGYPGEIDMDKKASEVFKKGLKLEYEYDFGSSTNLLLTVLEEYPIKADKKIVLLSRNEPLFFVKNVEKNLQP